MHSVKKHLIATAVVTTGLLAWSTSARSTEPDKKTQPFAVEKKKKTAPLKVDKKELNEFVDAQIEVGKIYQTYQPKISNASSPDEANKLQMMANKQMAKAIEATGLPIERYNQIADALGKDDKLRAQVQAMIQAKLEEERKKAQKKKK